MAMNGSQKSDRGHPMYEWHVLDEIEEKWKAGDEATSRSETCETFSDGGGFGGGFGD